MQKEIYENEVKNQIRKLKETSKRGIVDVNLPDLVMMQMIGNFDSFLNEISKSRDNDKGYEVAAEIIEDTKKQITSYKLFPGIINKTIEAQFGEKHATLRELGQNGIDSYAISSENRKVIYELDEGENQNILRVRDYGEGMTLEGLIRDLLIPYNSGKEFDPNKIGEHGIGWYSIVDLADFVKVTTKKKSTEASSQAFIYRDGEMWKAAISPSSSNGFYEKLHTEENGTEVTAFIPKSETNRSSIRDHLFKYLGLVDFSSAQIMLGDTEINRLGEDYEQASPTSVFINGMEGFLTIGISKREIGGGRFDAKEFRLRNNNLNKAVFTQRGLFVKYESINFEEKTVHHKLMQSLNGIGLDFWVDLPENVTLTKGRNNIIADHLPFVLEAMYRGFEDLFVDVVLEDDKIVHYTGAILESIADVFDMKYSSEVRQRELQKYSLGRRIGSPLIIGSSKAIDLGSYLISSIGKGFSFSGKFLREICSDSRKGLEKFIKNYDTIIAESLRTSGRVIGKTAGEVARKTIQYGPRVVIGAGAIYGGIEGVIYISNNYGFRGLATSLGYTGIGALGTAVSVISGKAVYEADWRGVFDKMSKSIKGLSIRSFSPISIGGGVYREMCRGMGLVTGEARKKTGQALSWIGNNLGNIGNVTYDLGMGIMNRFGLYVDIEEKRRLKMEKLRKKITKKYISRMQKDDFVKRIMDKRIIPAKMYYAEGESESKKYQTIKKSWRSIIEDYKNGRN